MQEILQWNEADLGDRDCLSALHIPVQCEICRSLVLNREAQIFILPNIL